jgi:hypothetical protein
MLILIAGPYRSGTKDDPALMAQNLARLERAALDVYEAGHVPVIGEWIALPIMRLKGSQKVGDPIYEQFAYPVAHRLLASCDAVFRIEGESKGADEDVRRALQLGKPVYQFASEIPMAPSENPARF